MKYTREKKEYALKLMSAPENRSVGEVSRLTGVPDATLYLWRREARAQGRVVPGDGQNPEDWSGADKLAVLIETAVLSEVELGEYCRQKGLYVEQVRAWRRTIEGVLSTAGTEDKQERHHDKKVIRGLEKELRRKEKALAETAALLVLSRKYEALWQEDEVA